MKEITWDDQWIGYDDADTIKQKKAWADNQCFGGTMAWSVDFNSGAGRQEDCSPHSLPLCPQLIFLKWPQTQEYHRRDLW